MLKKFIYAVMAISLWTGCTKECPPDEPDNSCKTDLTKGLLAYYPFTGNNNDASGNGNHAQAKNGAFLTTDFLGRSNSAAGFDGIDDYLMVPGSDKLNSDSFTISFQVMINNVNRRNMTISRVDFETAGSLAWGLHEAQPTDKKVSFGVLPGTDNCGQLYPYDPVTSGTIYPQADFQPGRWYNIIATFGSSTQNLYVDGVLQGTKTRAFSTLKKCVDAELMIGGWWKSDIVSIDGKIDEVRLYSRVISECEIKKLSETFNSQP